MIRNYVIDFHRRKLERQTAHNIKDICRQISRGKPWKILTEKAIGIIATVIIHYRTNFYFAKKQLQTSFPLLRTKYARVLLGVNKTWTPNLDKLPEHFELEKMQ